MNHGSLFSGIGGFDLAAQWIGWNNIFHCEWNEFGQKILKYYWPNAKQFGDITKSTFIEFRGKCDILTGGFPCQPFSTAGKREGTNDDRYLWPEMLRAIREIQPRYIVGENVRGLINWNGGMVFDQVCADLETEGYEIFPVLLPAAGVNAPHRRDRIWFIAYCQNFRFDNTTGIDGRAEHQQNIRQKVRSAFDSISTGWSITDSQCIRLEHGKETGNIRESQTEAFGERSESSESVEKNGNEWNVANTNSKMLEYRNREGKTEKRTVTKKRIESFDGPGKWQAFPSVSPICNGNDGISNRLDGITFSKWRKESIKGAGNAIVPQVALQIFKVIEQIENENRIQSTDL